MFFEKARTFLEYLANEFMLFLEYPLDYIEEFGDELKELDTTGKIIKIGKLLIAIFLLAQLVVGMVFAVILIIWLCSGSDSSVGSSLYVDALKSQKADAESRGDWREAADLDQEIRNNTPAHRDEEDMF